MVRVPVLLALALLGCLTESLPYLPGQLKTFTLEELVPLRPEFYPDSLSVQWISNTEYIYSDLSGVKKYNAANDTHTTLIDTIDLQKHLSEYAVHSFSKDTKYVLLTKHRQKVYRYSMLAEYYILDREEMKILKIAKDPLQVVVWGSGHSLCYVEANNVYYVADVKQPLNVTMLTNEGVPEKVYFGATDWIYEEEIFNAAEAVWFSPNGEYLAVASFNDTNVESAIYPYYGNPLDMNNQYPHLVGFKYPKAGRANPVVSLEVFNVNDPTSLAWNIPPPDTVQPEPILGRVGWASNHSLVVVWLNRRQNISSMIRCNLLADNCIVVHERSEPHGWIDVGEAFFDNNGTRIIQLEPSTNIHNKTLLHVARTDMYTNEADDMTPYNATVTDILGWNSENDVLFVIVSAAEDPQNRQLWSSTSHDMTCVSCRLDSCHHASGMFSPDASYGLVTCSALNLPPRVYLYSLKDNGFKSVLNNTQLEQKLNEYKLPRSIFKTIELEPNVSAHIRLTLPPDMEKGQKYPMIVRVYAGPGTTRVKDSFDLEYYTTYLASNRSYIVAAIDVRGSGAMGIESLYAINNRLGTVEITDTLAAIRRLVEMYDFIDAKRIGVWGWSYGGYATTMMLVHDDNNTVACGAAVAPVTSWLYYDTIYTERYMGTPAENPEGYKNSDLMFVAEKLRGKKYLLVHGTGDDNVHYQHSLQLAKRLQHADIAFEQMSYTDETHSLLGVSRHFYHTLDRFWTECFHSDN